MSIQPEATANDRSGPLLELLEQQHALVSELAGLSALQAELIREGRTDALLGLLTRRERIIERFTASQEDLARLSVEFDAGLDAVDEEPRTRIQTLIAEIGDRLAQVMQRDEADQSVLAAARRGAGEEVHAANAARNARSAYRAAATRTNRFADRTG